MSSECQSVTERAKFKWRLWSIYDLTRPIPNTRVSQCFVSPIKKLKFRLYFNIKENIRQVAFQCVDEFDPEQMAIRCFIYMQDCSSKTMSDDLTFDYDHSEKRTFHDIKTHSNTTDHGGSPCSHATVVCTVEILENFSNDDNKVDELKEFSDDFSSLFVNGTLSDMTLSAGGKDFPVHKNILAARSPVFAAMFEHKDSKEMQENQITIEDMSSDVCEEMLKHIYTGRNPSVKMSEYAFDLYIAADKYQLTKLKNVCEKSLYELLDIDTVCSVLLIADGCNAKKLKLKCVDFITDNSVNVMKTDGWKQIATKPALLVELFEHLSQKSHISSNKRIRVD